MSAGLRARLAWSLAAVTTGLAVVLVGLAALSRGLQGTEGLLDFLLAVVAVVYAGVGALIVARTDSIIGWLLAAIGLVLCVAGIAESYVIVSLNASGPLPATSAAAWLGAWSVFLLGLALALMFLLFPTGKLASHRWRWLAWAGAGSVGALVLITMFKPGPILEHPAIPDAVHNPLGIDLLRPIVAPVEMIAGGALMLALVGSVVALVTRFVGSRAHERLQLKWLAYVAGASLALFAVNLALEVASPSPVINDIVWLMWVLGLVVGVPGAVAVAILRYRLYDIDVVISRTLVYGSLAVFISVVYVGFVVGVGQLIGARSDNVLLAIAATGVVAVAFQPVKRGVERLANRLVYGRRSTPYEALSVFSKEMADAIAPEQKLTRMARTLAEGVGARRADVWLAVGDELRPAASWPEQRSAELAAPIPLADGALPELGEGVIAVAVVHEGELLGALAITKPASEVLDPIEEELLTDLAAQAGLVLRNVRLTAELLDRLEELRASRQRLVAAQDEARRRLERNLHDGAQQQLVSLKVRISLAEKMAEQGKPVGAIVQQLAEDTGEAIDTLRELAQGIYPPLLAAEGLPAALRSQARKSPLPVEIEAEGIGRYPQDVEAAVYFCCLEALQNIAKYAEASRAAISLRDATGLLTFSIADDGAGFDPARTRRGAGLQNMADRVDALDGELEVAAAPGHGVTVTGRIPIRAAAAAAAS